MYDFIAIDFETACGEVVSACSVGLAIVENLEIVESRHFFIRPPSLLFDKINIGIHGIKPEDVVGSPTFLDLWPEISHLFCLGVPIIAHNAHFDMSVLRGCLDYYKIERPNFSYVDSIAISTRMCDSEVGRSLEARAEYFGVGIQNHHNAEADAICCAEIVIACVNRSRYKTFEKFLRTLSSIPVKEFRDLKPIKRIGKEVYAKLDYESAREVMAPVADGEFLGKHVVITGKFDSFSRSILAHRLMERGAEVDSGVTKKTDYLFVGKQDEALTGPSGISSKEKKARKLIEDGQDIKIITEPELLEVLSDNQSKRDTNILQNASPVF
jgi:DNA polymerase-3 subunit epsilon